MRDRKRRFPRRWLKRSTARASLADEEYRLYVSPAIAQWLFEDADREGRPRPRLRIIDYSRLKPCCGGRLTAGDEYA
jgi:hypothetical protein